MFGIDDEERVEDDGEVRRVRIEIRNESLSTDLSRKENEKQGLYVL